MKSSKPLRLNISSLFAISVGAALILCAALYVSGTGILLKQNTKTAYVVEGDLLTTDVSGIERNGADPILLTECIYWRGFEIVALPFQLRAKWDGGKGLNTKSDRCPRFFLTNA